MGYPVAFLGVTGESHHSRPYPIIYVLVNTLVVCETVTSILNRIQVMSKEGRIYVQEEDSYSTHDKH